MIELAEDLNDADLVGAAARRTEVVLCDGRRCRLVRWRGTRRGRWQRTMRVEWHNGERSTLSTDLLALVDWPD